MAKFTDSMKKFLFKYHKDLIVPLSLGHLELFTEDIEKEYYEFVKTEWNK